MDKPKIPIAITALCAAASLAVALAAAPSSGEFSSPVAPAIEDTKAAQDQAVTQVSGEDAPGSEQDTLSLAVAADVADSPGQRIRLKDEGATNEGGQTETQQFSIPEGVDFEREVALIEVNEGASLEEVNAALAANGLVQTTHITADELADGVIKVGLSEGASVEDAVNSLRESEVIAAAQPNYTYYPMASGDEGDLRLLLDPLAEGEGAGSTGEPTEGTAAEGEAAELPAEAAEPTDAADPAEAPATAETEAAPVSPDAEAHADAPAEEPPLVTLEEQLSVNDPYVNDQWALSSMQVFEAWAQATCDGAVTVAVVDQGPMATHNDLKDNVVGVYNVATGGSEVTNVYRHGTHVAGIVSARANNGLGVAGVSHNANMLVVDVFSGATTDTNKVVKGLDYVMEQADALGIRVINLSVGAGRASESDYADDLLVGRIKKALQDHGIVTVCSAGNKENAPTGLFPYYEYPGDASCVVSVINLMRSDTGVTRSATSNYNVAGQKAKNISAPGTDIYSTVANNGYARSSGTSMAAPFVSGILALEFAAKPSLTASEAVSCLYASATDLGAKGFDEEYGWGEVNALAAVRAAKSGEYEPVDPEPEPEPEAPMPTVAGATRIPVGATASYQVTDGTLRLASGNAATLEGTTLRGVSAGTVTLAVDDANGVERSTFTVEVYSLSGCWAIASAVDQSYVLDIAWNSLYNCGNLIVFPYHGARNEAWLIEDAGGGAVRIRSALTGKVLDVENASTQPMGNILQFSAGDKPWQRWLMTVDQNNRITFINQNSKLAMDIEGGSVSPGGNVLQFPGHGGLNQKWVLKAVEADIGSIWDGVYKIATAVDPRYVLDVHGASRDNGANVELYLSNGGTNQQWVLTHLGGDVYRITSVCSGKSIDVAWGSTDAGANILQWDYSGAAWQKWWLKPNADGSYSFFRSGQRLALDACGGVAYPSCNVHQWPTIGSDAQRWWLTQY